MTAMHIAFGDSAAGNVKAALKIYAQQNPATSEAVQEFADHAVVLSCADQFSIGPIYEMDMPIGFFNRINWIGEFLEETLEPGMTFDDVDDHLERISDFYKKLAWIENDHKVVLWYGNNVIEQIGARLVSALLPDCELYGVELASDMAEAFSPEQAINCIAECPTATLMTLLNTIKPLDASIRSVWKEEWKKLVHSQGQLRVWREGAIESVSEDYFDETLMQMCTEQYGAAYEIIGKVMSTELCEVCEGFLSLRLKKILEQGQLIARGDVSFMKGLEIAKMPNGEL